MNVYKINEINKENLENKIKFCKPCLKVNHYFIICETDIFLQLDNIYFKENFQKNNGIIFTNIHINENIEKQILVFDNLIIKTVNDMFPIWFNKVIDMSDLLEYYIPTIKDYYENNEDITSDIFSYTSSEMSEDNETNETNEDNEVELIINCEIPYNYEDNDLDIMIFDSSNNVIEDLWDNIEVMGKKGLCVIKLSGIRIQKTKFCSVWELVQLKIL
jgi:hypothetical protein